MEGPGEIGALDVLLRSAVRQSNRPILIVDAEARVVWANLSFESLLGYRTEEVLGHRASDVMASPRMSPGDLATYRAKPWGRAELIVDALARAKDGNDLWVRVYSAPLETDHPEYAGYAVVLVTDLSVDMYVREVEREVLAALTSDLSFAEVGELLCRQVEAIAPGVLVSLCRVTEGRLDPWAAPSFPLGYQLAWQGVPIGEGVASCGTAAARGESVMVADLDTDPLWAAYRDVPLPDGLRSCWSYPVVARDGTVVGTFAFYFRDTAGQVEHLGRIAQASLHLCALAIEREAVRRQIDELSNVDTLTGLPNHRGWEAAVASSPALARLAPSAVVALEVDRLNDINRSQGYAAGDRAILSVGRALRSQLLPGEVLGRIERNRFALLLPGADAAAASFRADEVRRQMKVTVAIDGHDVTVTAAGGISLHPAHGTSAPDLLEHAILAVQDARERGIATAVFDASDSGDVRERLVLGNALREAIDHDRLMQWYQPQVDEDGIIRGVEALARWHHPTLGPIAPLRFIAVADELGRLPDLDFWAIARACRQAAAWARAGLRVGAVSVNVSPVTLTLPGLVPFVARQLDRHGVPASDLTLEVTERASTALPESGVATLHALRGLGIGLSIDDFGTGYSNLANLATLPVTEVKIDRSFTQGVLRDRRSQALVRAIVGLARDLELAIVAEGVETEEEREAVLALGCTTHQGFLYGAAVPPEHLAELLADGLGAPGGLRRRR